METDDKMVKDHTASASRSFNTNFLGKKTATEKVHPTFLVHDLRIGSIPHEQDDHPKMSLPAMSDNST